MRLFTFTKTIFAMCLCANLFAGETGLSQDISIQPALWQWFKDRPDLNVVNEEALGHYDLFVQSMNWSNMAKNVVGGVVIEHPMCGSQRLELMSGTGLTMQVVDSMMVGFRDRAMQLAKDLSEKLANSEPSSYRELYVEVMKMVAMDEVSAKISNLECGDSNGMWVATCQTINAYPVDLREAIASEWNAHCE